MSFLSDLKAAFMNTSPDVDVDKNELNLAYCMAAIDGLSGETTSIVEVPGLDWGTPVEVTARTPLYFVDASSDLPGDITDAGGFGFHELGAYTDLNANTPDPNGDVTIGQGSIENYTEDLDCLIVQNAGTYSLDWTVKVDADLTDDGDVNSLLSYMILNDDSVGPTYDLADRDSHTVAAGPVLLFYSKGHVNLWLDEGDELIMGIEWDANTEPTTAYFVGSILRIS